MPRDPKPWFRKDRDAWFVTINGRRYNLGADHNAAHDRFHELMLTGGEGDTSNGVITVFQLFDEAKKRCQEPNSKLVPDTFVPTFVWPGSIGCSMRLATSPVKRITTPMARQ